MKTFKSLSAPVVAAAGNPPRMRDAWADYVKALLKTPLWSADSQEGLRVYWKDAAKAKRDPRLNAEFDSPGLYIFGGGDDLGWPMYLGMTTGSMYKRLARRYVRGEKSQCKLAADYEAELLERNIEGFPPKIRKWYAEQYRGSLARLKGALAFAECGIDTVWFTLIPVAESNAVRDVEKELIRVANEWNRAQGHPLLINVQDM